MKKLTLLLFALAIFFVLIACKNAIFGPIYPITDFREYDYVVIAAVNKAIYEKDKYSSLKSFKATIKTSLKGNLPKGTRINGIAKNEESRAVCPVHLDENSDYLLLLSKIEGAYTLSRFSFPVKKEYKYFNDYISKITKILDKKKMK